MIVFNINSFYRKKYSELDYRYLYIDTQPTAEFAMEKLAVLMTLALAVSTAVLANPVFQDRGTEASNALYQTVGGGDCDDTDRCLRPTGEVELVRQTWSYDPDSDGDGLGDLTLESTETLSTSQGQIISSVKSERTKPEFKAGAELSGQVSIANVGDLDGDGFGDIAVGVEKTESSVAIKGVEISKRDARKGFYRTELSLSRGELVEVVANKSRLSKADSRKALETLIGATNKASSSVSTF